MAASHQEQENAADRPASPSPLDNSVGEPSGAQGSVSSGEEENINADPASGSLPGSPIPGIRGSEEDLFSQDETVYTDEPARPSDAAPSPLQTAEVEGMLVPTAASSQIPRERDDTLDTGLPSPFPPPRSAPPLSPLGVHPGPADTSSVASSRPAFQLNPQAPVFDAVARLYLQRGNRHLSHARDPMMPPNERSEGAPMADEDARVRRIRDAVYHMAMVYRRLMAADLDFQAEELNEHFTRLYGEDYENERVRVIVEEDDDPPEPVQEEEEPWENEFLPQEGQGDQGDQGAQG